MSVFETLRAAGDPEKARQMAAYMRDQFPFLGVPTPVRRALTGEFLRTAGKQVDWSFVRRCWEQPEREFQYVGVDYLNRRRGTLGAADVPNVRELIVTKSWWDTVDGLDMVVGDIALRHPDVAGTLLAWSRDDNIWLRRVAIDHQLQRKSRTDTGLLETILVNNLGQGEFFIQKAIGWSLRDFSKTDPEWVRGFLARYRDRLAPLSVREASKYL